MTYSETQARIEAIKQQIGQLPPGSVTRKIIHGREYFYRRWTENKKRKEKYIPMAEVDVIRSEIEQRKKLEQELKQLKAQIIISSSEKKESFYEEFSTNVRTGKLLRNFSAGIAALRKRECYQQLQDFVYGNSQDKVFILYGLRRTGKTTLIRQIFSTMNDDDLSKAAFIQITAKNTLAEVNHDLQILESKGFRYIFLDEVTLMEDFIEGAALFSDVFATCGMKIVLSGTDSLGFLFTEDEQLYDRCILLHTTWIPYREFESVLGIYGIDEYIQYGGTMSLGGVHYNETSTFATVEKTDEYVDTAIARNIQHSLRCYQYEGHFRHLKDLYDKNELTSAINRIVEDINHQFTLDVLTRDFKSHDLGVSRNNLRRDRKNPTDILDQINLVAVTERLRNLLEIRNKKEQSVHLNDIHAQEIKEYLNLLDLTQEIDVLHLPNIGEKSSRTVISQPGLRYAQAEALIESLLLDETFVNLSLQERTAVQDRILNEIKGRMLEDIVLLETKMSNPKKQVFVLQFPIGEFDMVVFDPDAGSCQIFEIKHSKEVIKNQYRHLINEEKCAQTEHRYGPITRRVVLYRGQNQEIDGIQYLNVEEYLRTIKSSKLS